MQRNQELEPPQIVLDISATLLAYTDAIDRADMNALLAVFTENAVWDYTPNDPKTGREEIRAFLLDRMITFAQTSHNVCLPRIVRQTENEADTISYFTAAHVLKDASRYTVYGRYIDTMVRTGERWLIRRRRVEAHVTEGLSRPRNLLPRKV